MLRQLLYYDPDQIMSVYATPHQWTPYFNDARHRRVIQDDLRLWDYKHQVMQTPKIPPWRVFLWVKLIELVVQLRPKALYRTFLHPDLDVRAGMRWYTRMGRRVIWRELWQFVTTSRLKSGPSVEEYWQSSDQLEENAHVRAPRKVS